MKNSTHTNRLVDSAIDACIAVGFTHAEWALLALVAASQAKLPTRELRALEDSKPTRRRR
jgi:hypothetical protein